MADFRPVVRDAYREILGREPDASGLAFYDQQMNRGTREDQMREALLRSGEFAEKNPGPGLRDRVGLNVHIPSNEILDDIAGNLGMKWARVDFDWFRLEPKRGEFRWEETDRVVDRSLELGIEVLATLSFTPPWASSSPASPRTSDPPASTAYWTEAVHAVLDRYRDRVRHWQFWNEPNVREFWTGSKTSYRTEILEPAARLTREVDPGALVVAPGLANLGDWREWFEEIVKSPELIDIINHHNYTDSGGDAILELERDSLFRPSLRTLMRELRVDDKAFWLTETGRRTSDGNQLSYYQDVVATLRREDWVRRLFFFHYWDGPGQGNGGFGIVNEDLSPKPAYQFLQSVLSPAEQLRAT